MTDQTPTPSTRSRSQIAAFLALMILVGLNLRPALSSLAPLLARLQEDIGISALAIGALTTLPVLCLGIFAPLAPWLSKRVGAERTLTLALALLASALLLRASHEPWRLYSGTLMIGAAIGIGGALLPALVKRELPHGADLMTGVYTMALCLGGAMGAGLSIPLADLFHDWRWSLGSWSLLAAIALVAWRLRMPHPWPTWRLEESRPPPVKLTSAPLAWYVTGLMGAQSSLAYIVFGWLPVLLQRRGLGESEAGWLLAISAIAQLVSALGAPWLARLGRDQRPAIWLVLTTTASGLLILLIGPLAWRWAGAILLGLGQGGSFSLALALITLRTGDSRLAGKLSGMAQGLGYCMAALGPLGVGLLLQFQADLATIFTVLLTICIIAAVFAHLAGRNRRLELDSEGRLVTRHWR